jgi:hypothetical protein
MREQGWAIELEEELESAAEFMGCSAIAVAAVPVQGMSFWTQRCGFKVVVPLKTETKSSEEFQDAMSDAAECLGHPVNELGDFLLRHMLLFTDTPLVAKELSSNTHSSKTNPCAGNGTGTIISNEALAQQPDAQQPDAPLICKERSRDSRSSKIQHSIGDGAHANASKDVPVKQPTDTAAYGWQRKVLPLFRLS